MKVHRYVQRSCLACALLLAACGQTGALYLPDKAVKTPVEIHPAAAQPTPPAASQPQDGKEQDKTKDKAPE
jgi:predicted small lipoprotein YifL